MSGNELDIQEIIEAAVLAAHEVGVKGMDEKIQAAINVAVTGVQTCALPICLTAWNKNWGRGRKQDRR